MLGGNDEEQDQGNDDCRGDGEDPGTEGEDGKGERRPSEESPAARQPPEVGTPLAPGDLVAADLPAQEDAFRVRDLREAMGKKGDECLKESHAVGALVRLLANSIPKPDHDLHPRIRDLSRFEHRGPGKVGRGPVNEGKAPRRAGQPEEILPHRAERLGRSRVAAGFPGDGAVAGHLDKPRIEAVRVLLAEPVAWVHDLMEGHSGATEQLVDLHVGIPFPEEFQVGIENPAIVKGGALHR